MEIHFNIFTVINADTDKKKFSGATLINLHNKLEQILYYVIFG